LLTISVDSSEGEEEIDPDAEEEEDEDEGEGEEEVEEEGEEEEDMDMDLDSEEEAAKPAVKKPTKTTTSSKRKPTAGASLKNPYPLEGKYINEDDREQYVLSIHHSLWREADDSLSTLPEIERENILAGRLEEMQKFKDSQNLDAMYKMAGMGGEEDEEEEEDEPRKRSKLAGHDTTT
jgi:RNA polymerase-associated protein RTF1